MEQILLYICIFFCGWVCHSIFSYIMSLGYSVMLLRNLLRDVVYMIVRIVEVAYLVHEMRMIELARLNLSQVEKENHVKLHEIQMNNMKRDIVSSITRNFPKSFSNLVEFHDWDTMMKWIDKELKINKEAK